MKSVKKHVSKEKNAIKPLRKNCDSPSNFLLSFNVKSQELIGGSRHTAKFQEESKYHSNVIMYLLTKDNDFLIDF